MPVDTPALVLWAWDRDDDLSFIDIRDTAVAYLAATVVLRGESVFLTPRHHPLAAPKGTRLVAVAHVEIDRHEPPVVSDAQARDFAATLAALRENLPGEFLQIDFEARSSQRAFFVKAVAALRQRLPDAVLSATALSSWCLNERWIERQQWTRWSRCSSAWAPIAGASGSISPAEEIFGRRTAAPASASRPMNCRLQYGPADASTPSAQNAGMPKHTTYSA